MRCATATFSCSACPSSSYITITPRNRVQIPPRRWPLPDRKHGRFCTFGAPESLARTWAKSASSLLPAGSPLLSCAVIESTFRFFHFRTPIDELRERLEPVTKSKETFLRNGISLILREGWEQRLRHDLAAEPINVWELDAAGTRRAFSQNLRTTLTCISKTLCEPYLFVKQYRHYDARYLAISAVKYAPYCSASAASLISSTFSALPMA